MDRSDVLNTMDAMAWTNEFMDTKQRLGDAEFDHAMMLAWFANAIMAGYDHKAADHRREVEGLEAKVKELEDSINALLEQQTKRVEDLRASLNQVSIDLQAAWRREADLQGQLEAAQAAQDVMWTRKGYLEVQVAQLTEERDANMQGWTELDVICKQAINERDKLKADLTTLRGQLEAARAVILNTHTASLALDYVGVKVAHADLQAQVAQLTAERDEQGRLKANLCERLSKAEMSIIKQNTQLKQLRGLVEALPVVEGDIDTVCYGICDWRINKGGGMFAVESDAEAFAALLRYRATLAQAQILKSTNSAEISRCAWKYDTAFEMYETACKHAYVLVAGDLAQNKHRYCPYCGGKIRLEAK